MSERVKANILEKALVNWAAIPDSIFYAVRSKLTKDKYFSQSFKDRLVNVGKGRVEKYEQLLNMKKEYGKIDERVERLHKKSLCAYNRLVVVEVWVRKGLGIGWMSTPHKRTVWNMGDFLSENKISF